jgi:hypothetical protein
VRSCSRFAVRKARRRSELLFVKPVNGDAIVVCVVCCVGKGGCL